MVAEGQAEVGCEPLTIPRLCSSPALGGTLLAGVQLSPDGKWLTFLKGREKQAECKDLWALEVGNIDLQDANASASDRAELLIDADGLEISELSNEEKSKARRERMRIGGLSGIVEYHWSACSSRILVPASGSLYVFDVNAGKTLKKLRNLPEGPYTDAKFSPQSKFVSFVLQRNLWIYCLEKEEATQLTHSEDEKISFGVAEFVAQEEMHRMTGYWWAKDDTLIAFTKVDENPVEVVTRNEIYADGIKLFDQPYPYAGKPNAKVELFVQNVNNTASSQGPAVKVPLKLHDGTDAEYLVRVYWAPPAQVRSTTDPTDRGCAQLVYMIQDRQQKLLELHLATLSFPDPETPAYLQDQSFPACPTKLLVKEANGEKWVNIPYDCDVHFDDSNSGDFLWATERSGFRHLIKGNLNDEKSPVGLTNVTGDNAEQWQVDSVCHVNSDGTVFFTARVDDVRESHLYTVNWKTAILQFYKYAKAGTTMKDKITKITDLRGMHSVKFAKDPKAKVFVDSVLSVDCPPRVALYGAASESDEKSVPKFLCWISENSPTKTPNHPLTPYFGKIQTQPEFGIIDKNGMKNSVSDNQNFSIGGQTVELHYRLWKPTDFDPAKKYPVLVHVYGGPHVQMTSRGSRWHHASLFLQFLLQQGILIFELDNRGSANRGVAFENCIYRRLGELEVQDQCAGVEFLRSLSFVDAKKIGIYGHSYGGYMTLLNTLQHSDLYCCGVSGAPVTDWRFYDSHYTERYQGTPEDNEEGYNASSVFPYVEKFDDAQCRLLIYHGMADDNVQYENTTRVYKALQDAGKVFYAMDYPGSKHSMDGVSVRTHLYKLIFKFLKESFALAS